MKKLGKITAFILVFAALLGGIVYSLNQASGQIQNEEAQLIRAADRTGGGAVLRVGGKLSR